MEPGEAKLIRILQQAIRALLLARATFREA